MQRIVSYTVSIYTVIFTFWFLWWLLIGDGVWWMTLLNSLAPFAFFLLPLIVVSALASRQPWLLPVSLVPLLIFVTIFAPYVVPQLATGDVPADLRVMSYNVLFSNTDYDAVANVIRAQQPDIVALQEVQPPMMLQLLKRLRDLYPYSSLGDEYPWGTTAIFSRHPLRGTRILNLEADRSAIVTQAQIGETKVTVIVAHLLAYNWWMAPARDIPNLMRQRTAQQNRQAEILLEAVAKHEGVVILACDCNSKVISSSYQLLHAEMTHTWRENPWPIGRSKPAGVGFNLDLGEVDHLFYRGPLRSVGTYAVRDAGGSDHAPILVEFVGLAK